MLANTLLFASLAFVAQAASPPAQLYDPLVAQKILTVAQNESSSATYPQYTDPVAGIWQYFGPDTWTTGSKGKDSDTDIV